MLCPLYLFKELLLVTDSPYMKPASALKDS